MNQVSKFVRSSHVCQIADKSRKQVPVTPLFKVIIVSEPCTHFQMDVVGPVPRTDKGNVYIVTLVDLATPYMHSVAVRYVTVKNVGKNL